MENIAAEIGSTACHIVSHLLGGGGAVCYNSTAASTIGYAIVLGLAMILAFRRVFSQIT